MSEELKPCPFCGGKALQMNTPYGEYYVMCKKCDISTRAFSKPETSIKHWNRRVPS